MTETSNEKFNRLVIPNMATNIMRAVVTALIGLFLVPYYIDELGVSAYSLIPLITSVSSYVMIIADAMTSAYSRYLIIALQEGDAEKVDRTYTTTVFGLARLVTMTIPLVVIISIVSPYVFQIGSNSSLDVQLLFLMVLMSSLLATFGACFTSIFNASNKLYQLYTIRIGYALLQVFFIVLFFMMEGASLILIGVSYVLSAVIYVAVLFTVAKRTYPKIRVRRKLNDKKLLGEMSKLGGWSVVSKIGILMFIQTSLILVNLYLGSDEEGYFAVVVTMMTMVNTSCLTVSEVVTPIIYRAYSSGRMDRLLNISKTALKFIALIVAFPVAYICIFSSQILTVWVGADFADHLSLTVSAMILVQVAGCCTNAVSTIPTLMLKVRPVALMTVMIGVVNIALGAILMTYTDLGSLGAGLAWMVSIVFMDAIFYPLFTAKILSVNKSSYYRPMLSGYMALALCLVCCELFDIAFTLPGTWTSILISFGIGFVLYFTLMVKFGFKGDEKEVIVSILPRLSKKQNGNDTD